VSVTKGQKIYLKNMKKACGINGAEFAKKHTQKGWKTIHDSGIFALEVSKICPNLKEFKASWIEHIYDFSFEYARDSGNVPSCG